MSGGREGPRRAAPWETASGGDPAPWDEPEPSAPAPGRSGAPGVGDADDAPGTVPAAHPPSGSAADARLAEERESLNPAQREAVEHGEGPILVLAGAGSGKTRVLTTRVAALVRDHGVSPDRILAVTFTNKAAGEMKERIRNLLGQDPAGLWIGTFHAIGARMLRAYADRLGYSRAFTIFDAEESLREVKRVQESLELDPKRWKPKALRAVVSDAKNQLLSPQEFHEEHAESFDLFNRKVAQLYPAYQRSLEEQNALDFDDLLVKPVELLTGHPEVLERYRERFAFLLVDEYQDTNRAQFRFLELLAGGHHNLMVVGDDDQSIYGWRGADIRNILDFEETYPEARVVRLETNYRSTPDILEAANAVISENLRRKGKTLRTDRPSGERLTVVRCQDERDEARWIVEEVERRLQDENRSYRDFAALYRTNAQSRALEDAFRRRGVPHRIVGGVRFYERREIQDVLAYLRLISNARDDAAFSRVVNYPRRGIGGASQERLRLWAAEQGIPLLEAAGRAPEAPELPKAGVKALARFSDLVKRYADRAASYSVGELLEELVEELDLLTHLRNEGPDGEDRAENVKELIAGAVDFEPEPLEEWEEDEGVAAEMTELDLFLQQAALITDLDRTDADEDAVTLMTLHNAKGLEFPCVFIAGLEEGLFPLARAFDEPETMEEERRLFYVGLTRAEDKLILTHARERRRAGDIMPGHPSSFLEALPDELVEERKTRGAGQKEGGRATGASTGRSSARASGGDGRGSRRAEAGEEDANQDQAYLRPGERVVHGTFGSGTVAEISGFGRDVRVTVDFDTVGRKKLLARYAHLEREF